MLKGLDGQWRFSYRKLHRTHAETSPGASSIAADFSGENLLVGAMSDPSSKGPAKETATPRCHDRPSASFAPPSCLYAGRDSGIRRFLPQEFRAEHDARDPLITRQDDLEIVRRLLFEGRGPARSIIRLPPSPTFKRTPDRQRRGSRRRSPSPHRSEPVRSTCRRGAGQSSTGNRPPAGSWSYSLPARTSPAKKASI